MKKALRKDTVKEIKNTFKRFLSILLMAFLGVGFFAGIKATSPDMVETIDAFYREQRVNDLQVISTLGLTNEDLEELKSIDGVEEVQGNFSADAKIELENKEIIAKVMTYLPMNKPILLEGKYPETENECVVEKSFLTHLQKQMGDSLVIEIEDTKNDQGEAVPFLQQKEVTIVGTVSSPMYISRDRGTSKLGNGKVDYYLYVSPQNISASEIYTEMNIKIQGTEGLITSEQAYENRVEDVKQNIEAIKQRREQARYEALVGMATKQVEEAENEFLKKKQEAENKIAEAKQEIESAKQELLQGEQELEIQKNKAETSFQQADKQLKQAEIDLAKKEKELTKKEQEANSSFTSLEQQKQSLREQESEIQTGLAQVKQGIAGYEQALQDPSLSEAQKQIIEQQKKKLEEQKEQLEQNKIQVTQGIAQIENGITQGRQELSQRKRQLNEAKKQLQTKKQELTQTKQNTNAKLTKGENDLTTANQKIEQGEQELTKQEEEANTELASAEQKLMEARDEISQIEHPKWYILDRYGNAGYTSFIQDTESVANIGKVFPVVFFVVATLISLTSMTRMVEEQRTQIGTLKALGYNKIQIAGKYLLYASLACLIGGFLGMSVGFVLLPKIIWMMYGMMYQISEIHLNFNWVYGGTGLLLISLCIVGATLYAVMMELIHTPATLMRPKAPKMGKRVLLEKIPFIWKHLRFSQKVTVRNLFRYKKRFLMTIIGILGCTSLILAGFGLRDSIRSILPSQYQKVFHYDEQINLKNNLQQGQKEELIHSLANLEPETESQEEIKAIIVETHMTSGKAISAKGEEEVQFIVPSQAQEIDQVIQLNDIKTKEALTLGPNDVFLSDKAAQLLGVKEGDTLTIEDSHEVKKEVKITHIVENYIYHFVYMAKDLYETMYEEPYETNVLLTKEINLSAEEIMQMPQVASVSQVSSMVEMIQGTMDSLNYVVIVLIVSAGLLAFVVLYNLSNVNISERIRELATIKVLGFYDKEVYSYVTRETVILSLIGILFGLIAGYFLNAFIIGTCEINMLRFSRTIQPMSYVYSALITIGFTLIVNLVTYFSLKKIDMIESLKSVE
jgi:putative ABC transport system permease protein